MSDLVVVEFPSEAKAEEVRQKLLDMQKDYLIELGDAVIAVKQPNGRVKLNQLVHPTAIGAATGTLWGTLIGLIFLMPLIGAAVGAASGAIGGALTDVGLRYCCSGERLTQGFFLSVVKRRAEHLAANAFKFREHLIRRNFADQ